MKRVSFIAIAIVLGSVGVLSAQVTNGTLTGLVTDGSGRPVAQASVQVNDFTVDGTAADSVLLNVAHTTATFTYNVSPVTTASASMAASATRQLGTTGRGRMIQTRLGRATVNRTGRPTVLRSASAR